MINNSIPEIIHWHICGDCQLNCQFCYSVPGFANLNTEECKRILKKIKDSRIKAVIFTGGEPLLRKDIIELITFCKKQGLSTALDTNAILLRKEVISKLDGILDRIGLPLDGPSQIHDVLRGRRGHFQEVVNSLQLLKDSKIRIKINTVVNKINLLEVGKIGEILTPFRISLWSLYQFYPLARGYTFRKRFKVTKKDFIKTTNKIKREYPQLPIEVVPYSIRKGTYFSISSAGSVFTTPLDHRKAHICLGNVLKNDLLELWNSHFIHKEESRERYSMQLELFNMSPSETTQTSEP